MDKKVLKDLEYFAKKIGSYKPVEPPKKPKKDPSVKQLKQAYKFDPASKTIKEV
jgi:hypothetical protein